MNNGSIGLNTYYVPLATFIVTTTYHSAFGCSPTVLFDGREPITPIDLRFNNTSIEVFSPNNEHVFAMQDTMNERVFETKLKLTEMYSKPSFLPLSSFNQN